MEPKMSVECSNFNYSNVLQVRLKLPPAIIFLIFAGLMYLLAKFLPVGYFDFFGRTYLIKGLLVLGLVVVVIAIVQFISARTTVAPHAPEKASALVTRGIYRYTRNPMYLGFLLFLIGFGLYLGNAFNTLLAAGFVYYMNAYQIKPEEEALTEKFGSVYKQYCREVRRWF